MKTAYSKTVKTCLSIAGSDSSGGAGIQADLKTMCALGVYGMTAITSVTAQNTQEVAAVEDIKPDIVAAQIKAVFDDIPPDAVKIGMVSSRAIITTIRDSLVAFHAANIVLDPVMVSKTGCALLQPDAQEALTALLKIACVVTPNIPEAEILAAMPIKTPDDMKRAAEKIAARASSNTSLSVLVKGGHRTADSDAGDLLFTHGRFVELPGERINTKNTHGTGCTLSSAIASRLALGDNVEDAVRFAKAYITQAIKDNLGLGKGCGPVGHLVALYRQAGIQPAAGL